MNRVDVVDGVNNQVLIATNVAGQVGAGNIMFQAPDLLLSSTSQGFPDKLTTGTDLEIENAEVAVPMVNQTSMNFSVALGGGVTVRYYARDGLNIMEFRGSAAQINGAVSASFRGMSVGDVVRTTGMGFTNMRQVVQTFRFTNNNTRLLVAFTGEVQWDNRRTIQSSGSVTLNRFTSETLDFAGTYRIGTLSDTAIKFVIPRAGQRTLAPGAILSFPFAVINSQATDKTTPTTTASIAGEIDRWIGPFEVESAERFVSNFVARRGLYSDDGENQNALTIQVEVEVKEITPDAPTGGPPRTFQTSLVGSDEARRQVASTLDFNLGTRGKYSIRARRITETDLDFNGAYIDEVRWRDAYGLTSVEQTHFGNVTTLQAVTQASSETAGGGVTRKLNLLATRCVQRRGEGALIPSNRADDILSAVCLDPYIGNRSRAEVDFDNFYDTLAEVRAYFAIDDAGEFSYTFDKNNLSFEDIVSTIAQAVFCVAFRQGNVIRIKFEKATTEAALLFNHVNKVPGTETRTRRFGNANGNDGVDYEWIDPDDHDVRTAIYYPPDRSALRPMLVESLGVRNRSQAFFHANRIWSKVQYQNVLTDFEATREAHLVSRPDRVLIADNTRQGTQDGTVLSQDGLALELSEDVDLTGTGPYQIFLQHSDGTTESIAVTAGAHSSQVILANAPRRALNLDVATYARATYILGDATQTAGTGFLVNEKRIRDISKASIRAVSYDPAYYLADACPLIMDARQGFVNSGYLGRRIIANELADGSPALTIADGRFVVASGNDPVVGVASMRALPTFVGPYSVSVSIAFTAADGFARLIGAQGNLEILNPFFIVNRDSFGISAKAGESSSANFTFELNREYYVAGTYDNDEDVRLYIDGVPVDATTRIRGLTLPSTEERRVDLGGGELPQYRACNYNNLRLYNRVLGPEEIARLHGLNL